ncbi:MAG: YdiU family protein [Opitutae bacterium]|jgi:serine/tyrosine/threonine adenylyltransferase|nr:YdiU family protein [Opitutae bacterium]
MTQSGFHLESTYAELPGIFFSKLSPTPVSQPELVIFNEKLADEIGLDLSGMDGEERTKLLSGNLVPDGTEPFAQAYAGHQFGNFTMLGDGRAIVLGEHITSSGQRLDLQFKGSGRTPYSRGGDGRAALGPMLREYVISEGMHALGIPTTRSLAVVATGETVYRENELPGAILTRIAGSHIRVGTFEYASLHEDKAITQALLDYLIDRHFPAIKEKDNQALALLEAVIEQQAGLITHWMRVGFIHGVMNTDNMALSGETIDYGPCAFMDVFAPDTVFSSIDRKGRYAYANQPFIAQWNLARLAESLLPLMHDEREDAIGMAEDSLNAFEQVYKAKWLSMMGTKLGLAETKKEDEQLVTDLLDWMHENATDYTNTFRDLSQEELPDGELYATESFQAWHTRWQARLGEEEDLDSSLALRKSVNPVVIPRNHKVEEALQAGEEGDHKPFHDLLSALENPYEDGDHLTPYQSPPKPEEKVLQTFCGT